MNHGSTDPLTADPDGDALDPEVAAARRLADVANALHRHGAYEPGQQVAALANILAMPSDAADPATRVARRDVALAVLGLEAP